MRKVLQLLVMVVGLCAPWLSTDALAACTGGSPNWTSSPDRTSVAACISNASNGDTINVTSGSATWSGRIAVTKSVSIIGAGAGSTVISSGGFTIGVDGCPGAAPRISGFTFNSSVGSYTFAIYCSVGWRIDHNTITYGGASDMLYAVGFPSAGVEGLFDNNTVTYGRIVYYGEAVQGTTGAGMHRWAEPLDIGTSKAIYVEDNTINWPNGSSGSYLNHLDGNFGCRYVARFNRVNNGRFEAHALQGDNSRACRMWEIYNNTMTTSGTPSYRPFLIRGGTGAIFHNTTDGGFSGSNTIHLDNPRSHQNDVVSQMGSWGACDDIVDTPKIDGHATGGEGYLCRDQIGSSTDASLWNGTTAGPAQAKYAAAVWRNIRTDTSSEIGVEINCVGDSTQCTRQRTKHIVESRDYYTYRSSFNGTAGIGEGPLSARPATCTTGVMYWATDQGEWNARNAGPDGQMYRCVAANTWSLHYVPFAYPHPLQNGASMTSPAPPANVRIIR